MPRKRTPAQPDPIETPSEEQTSRNPDFSALREFDVSLQDFLLENQVESGFTCRVFRTYKAHDGRERTSYLTSWTDTVPTYDAIRDMLGPGRYRINLTYTDARGNRQATGRIIEIDPDPAAPKSQPPQLYHAQPAPAPGLSPHDLISLFTVTMKTLGDMAKGNGKSTGADLGEIAQVFAQSMGMMAQQQVGIMGQMQRQMLDLPEPAEERRKPEGLLDLIGWAWNTFGAKLLENPALGKMFGPQVRTMPAVEYLLNNPAEYKRVIAQFSEAEGVPAEKLYTLLGALDVPTPDELTTGQAQSGEREESTQQQ